MHRTVMAAVRVFLSLLLTSAVSGRPRTAAALDGTDHTEAAQAAAHQDPAGRDPGAAAPRQERRLEPFAKGTVHLSAAGNVFQDISRPAHDAARLAGLELEFSLFVLDDLCLGTALQFSDRIQPHVPDAFFGGGAFSICWHFLHLGPVSLYAKGALGLAGATAAVPAPDGTRFNFFQRVGNGFTVRLTRDIFLFAEGGYMHLSNANIQGPEHNPTLNAIGGELGIRLLLGSAY